MTNPNGPTIQEQFHSELAANKASAINASDGFLDRLGKSTMTRAGGSFGGALGSLFNPNIITQTAGRTSVTTALFAPAQAFEDAGTHFMVESLSNPQSTTQTLKETARLNLALHSLAVLPTFGLIGLAAAASAITVPTALVLAGITGAFHGFKILSMYFLKKDVEGYADNLNNTALDESEEFLERRSKFKTGGLPWFFAYLRSISDGSTALTLGAASIFNLATGGIPLGILLGFYSAYHAWEALGPDLRVARVYRTLDKTLKDAPRVAAQASTTARANTTPQAAPTPQPAPTPAMATA